MTSLVVFSTAAYADDTDPKAGVLTTQRYVDDGLEFVYKVATGASNGAVKTLQTDVGNLQTAVGTTGTGLTGRVEDLEDEIGNYSDPSNNVTASGVKGDIEALENEIGNYSDPLNNVTASGLKGDVEALQDTVGDSSGGLVKDVADLKTTVNTLDSLNTDDLDGDKTYVLKTDENGNGSWTALETVNTWNPTFLTNP